MRHCRVRCGLLLTAIWLSSFGSANADFVELISNGDFETGSFTGWTVDNQAGSFPGSDWFISTPGSASPFSGFATAANAVGGNFYAVTDQSGAGAHVLLQAFTVPVGAISTVLSYQMFANDQSGSGGLVNPAGLDFNAVPNQHARVDILAAGSGNFSTAAVDIVSNLYLGVDAGANPHPYTSYSFDVSALVTPGTSYILRFGEVDNQFFFQNGVDNVSILATTAAVVPEPSSMALLCLGGAAGLARFRRRRNAVLKQV